MPIPPLPSAQAWMRYADIEVAQCRGQRGNSIGSIADVGINPFQVCRESLDRGEVVLALDDYRRLVCSLESAEQCRLGSSFEVTPLGRNLVRHGHARPRIFTTDPPCGSSGT